MKTEWAKHFGAAAIAAFAMAGCSGMMGSPEADMGDMDMGTPDDTGAAAEAAAGEDMAMDVESESTTTVTTTFDELTGAEHVINLHESAENIGNYIACGAITGEPSAEGVLEVTLDEQNASGLEGMATLTDNGDGTIDVHVQLWHVMADMGIETVPVNSADVEVWRQIIEEQLPEIRRRRDIDVALFDEMLALLREYRASR